MFDILMELPLFRGVSHERMTETVGKAKLNFTRYIPGATIVNAGDRCDCVTFVISGAVRLRFANSDGLFAVAHTISAPDVLVPDFMFGRATDYPCTITAVAPTGILRISKNDYINIINSDRIFMFNYLNTLSMNAQKAVKGLLSLSENGTAEHLAMYVSTLTQPRGTDIAIQCLNSDFCSLFGVTRQQLTKSLEQMAADGTITFTDTEIRVLDRRTLLSQLYRQGE